MTTIDLTPNSAHWDAEIGSLFSRFERRLRGGLGSRVTQLQAEVGPIVEKGRRRPADPTKQRETLTYALQQSIRSTIGSDMGIIVGDKQVLNQFAPYWHAIEVGSDHIIGMEFFGYLGPGGVSLPHRSRFRADSRRATFTEMTAGGVKPGSRVRVTKGIKPHRYLPKLSVAATRAVREETHMRIRESFGGVPYKRQGV